MTIAQAMNDQLETLLRAVEERRRVAYDTSSIERCHKEMAHLVKTDIPVLVQAIRWVWDNYVNSQQNQKHMTSDEVEQAIATILTVAGPVGGAEQEPLWRDLPATASDGDRLISIHEAGYETVCFQGRVLPAPQPEASLGTTKEIERLKRSLDFHQRRTSALQKEQGKMRDPERQVVCDILANGYARDWSKPEASPCRACAAMREALRSFAGVSSMKGTYGYKVGPEFGRARTQADAALKLSCDCQQLESELIRVKGLVVERDAWLPQEERTQLESDLAQARTDLAALCNVHNVFCAAIRKGIGMECEMPLTDIVDNVVALSNRHREQRQELSQARASAEVWAARVSSYVSDEQTFGTHRELSDKIGKLESDLALSRASAEDHCRRADTAEGAVGQNCSRIAELEAQKQELIEINHKQHDQSAAVYCELEKRLTATELMLKAERKLSRARPQSGWISTDNPPPCGRIVIVEGGLAQRCGDNAWISMTGYDAGKRIQWPVTHWMEIPPLPKFVEARNPDEDEAARKAYDTWMETAKSPHGIHEYKVYRGFMAGWDAARKEKA